MKREIELLPPMMPNFVGIKMPPGQRQDGLKEGLKIPIEDFTEEEAEEYGELMKQTFIDHWKCKANAKGDKIP